MTEQKFKFEKYIRSIPDWPAKGILFRDITPLLADAGAFAASIEALSEPFLDAGIEYVAAIEARGFIFGSAIAAKLAAGFVPIRKQGKLPSRTESVTYDLEYGTDTLEVHRDAIRPGSKVLMVDDLLATGGTMAAAVRLIEKIGGTVEAIAFLIELTDLAGRQKLTGRKLHVCLSY